MSLRYDAYLKVHPERREELEERAAIMEHDGLLKKEDAEDFAVKWLEVKYNKEGPCK